MTQTLVVLGALSPLWGTFLAVLFIRHRGRVHQRESTRIPRGQLIAWSGSIWRSR